MISQTLHPDLKQLPENFWNFISGMEDNNARLSFGQWSRYYSFLQFIKQRYETANTTYVDRMAERTKRIASQEPGSRPLTMEEWNQMAEDSMMGLELHLEIESFYVFAKILLDRIANTVALLFGITLNKKG